MNVLPLPEDEAEWGNYDIMFATKSGDVRRNKLSDFATVNRAGKIAMKLEDGDHMVGVALCTAEDDVMLTTALGRAIRFKADDVRVFKGRDSTGVRGVRLQSDDEVISMAVLGKRSSAYEYRRTGRGGQGLTAHGLGGRAGTRLAASFPVEDSDELLLVTSGGQMIRTPVDQVRIVGRSSQGVTIFRTADGEKVVSVERLPDSGGGDEDAVAGETSNDEAGEG
jgi:DNA gyrase subunit A